VSLRKQRWLQVGYLYAHTAMSLVYAGDPGGPYYAMLAAMQAYCLWSELREYKTNVAPAAELAREPRNLPVMHF
jgi:hypothetical protein